MSLSRCNDGKEVIQCLTSWWRVEFRRTRLWSRPSGSGDAAEVEQSSRIPRKPPYVPWGRRRIRRRPVRFCEPPGSARRGRRRHRRASSLGRNPGAAWRLTPVLGPGGREVNAGNASTSATNPRAGERIGRRLAGDAGKGAPPSRARWRRCQLAAEGRRMTTGPRVPRSGRRRLATKGAPCRRGRLRPRRRSKRRPGARTLPELWLAHPARCGTHAADRPDAQRGSAAACL
jgi:hypothetical protein